MPRTEVVKQIAILLSYLMIIMALAISASATIKQMVRLYQAQAWVLTFVVLLTSLEPNQTRAALALLAILPATLAVVVPSLLGRASLVPTRASNPDGEQPPGLRTRLWRTPARADLIWLQHGRSRLPAGLSAIIDLVLIGMAQLVAYRLAFGKGGTVPTDVVPSLAVAIALLLQGLFTMSNKRDIIAQIIGLLVIEHGLFLAAVRVAPPQLAFIFVLSLFFYVLVTLTILLWILPELHRASTSIEVTDNRRLAG
jgi:hydrogenase-4 membrane subunit HyfE